MAEMQETRIENVRSLAEDEDETSFSDTGNDDKVLKWVQAVDNHIDESSVEIMKLGMRTELTQMKRDNARKSSDLYHALANCYPDSEVRLARYVYALERLGRRRHGFRAVRRLNEFSIKKPAQFVPTDKSVMFNFYQCLVDISVHLDIGCHSRLAAYAAKMFLDGENPRLIKSPHELLIKLLQRQVITKDNQKDLVEALHIVGADKCVEYIHCYRHQNGLLEITDTDYNKATLLSNVSSTTDEGSRPQTLKRSVHQNNLQELSPENRDGTRQLTTHQSSTQTASTGHRKGWILCFVLANLVALLIVATIVFMGFGTATLLRNDTNVALYHDNATIILTPVDHFFIKSLTVTQDAGYPGDSDHEINLYRLNRACNDLPFAEMKYTIYDHSIHALNKTILYLLPGSFITYSICASTNHTEKPDRLELLVLDNLERVQSFDISNSFYKFFYFSIGVQEDIKYSCNSVTIGVEKAGYYYFVFLPPSHPAQFELNVTYAIRWIDLTQFPEQSNYTLHKNHDSHKFSLDSSPLAKRSCLVATIKSAVKPYVHIRLQFEHFLGPGVEMGIGSAILVIATLMGTIVVFIFYHRLTLKQTSHSQCM